MQSWIIDKQTAIKRIENFSSNKKKYLDPLTDNGHEILSFQFSREEFLDTFNTVISTKNAAGLRFIFAGFSKPVLSKPERVEMDKETARKMTLIVLPTEKLIGPSESRSSSTKLILENMYYIYLKKDAKGLISEFKKVNITKEKEKIERWIAFYQHRKLPVLELAGKLSKADFEETKSLWYSSSIFRNAAETPGMLDYIDGNTEISSIIIHLTAQRDTDDNPFQLDLVFELFTNQEKSEFTRLSSFDIKENLKLSGFTEPEKDLIASTYGDTGIPCPPRICN